MCPIVVLFGRHLGPNIYERTEYRAITKMCRIARCQVSLSGPGEWDRRTPGMASAEPAQGCAHFGVSHSPGPDKLTDLQRPKPKPQSSRHKRATQQIPSKKKAPKK